MTYYPSIKEVEAHQRAEHESLKAATLLAEYHTPNSPPIFYRLVVGDIDHLKRQPGREAPAPFLDEQARVMRRVADHPNDGVASHFATLGIGVGRGNLILRQLEAAGYLSVHDQKSSGPGGGRPRKIAVLSASGLQMLKAYEERTRKT